MWNTELTVPTALESLLNLKDTNRANLQLCRIRNWPQNLIWVPGLLKSSTFLHIPNKSKEHLILIRAKLKHINMLRKLGVVVYIYNSSSSGGWGRRIISLDNWPRPHLQILKKGWRHSSVVEGLLHMHEVTGSIPGTAKQTSNKENTVRHTLKV